MDKKWEVERFGWSDYSGEFGETLTRVRRVKFVDGFFSGLMRFDWYSPNESGTYYEWGGF